MSDASSDSRSNLSYKGSVSGLKGLIKNRIKEGFTQVLSGLEELPTLEGGGKQIPLELIYPCPDQPRQVFEPKALEELAATMKELGQAQAITVRKTEQGFEIISGERRYRAAKLAGLADMDCIVKDVEGKDAHLLALVENIQRQDLLPIEEAHFLKKVIHENPELSLEKLAKMLGSHKSTISEKIQLTEVPGDLQKALYSKGRNFTHRHWRVLSRIKDEDLLREMIAKALEHQMSVAELERSLAALGIKKARRTPKNRNLEVERSKVLTLDNWKFIQREDDLLRIRSLTVDKRSLSPEIRKRLLEDLETLVEELKLSE